MAKKRGAVRNGLEYLGLLFGSVLLGWTPLFFAKAVAVLLADVWRFVDKRHRLRVIEQSMACLGIGKAAAERLARDNYRHYVLTVLEIIRVGRLDLDAVMRRVDVNGADALIREALADGKGLVVATGHIGNWEWGCLGLGRLGAVSGVIARPLDNPLIDGYLNRVRAKAGVEVWDKTGAIRKAMTALRRGKGFAAVIDQDGGYRGVMAPFFGRPASTMSLPVELAMRTSSPILVCALMRDGGVMRFKAVCKRVHRPRAVSGEAEETAERARLLADVNADLCDIIREYPEQWIWILNRWKTARVRER